MFRDLKSMMLTIWKLLHSVFSVDKEPDSQNSIFHMLVHKIAIEKYQGQNHVVQKFWIGTVQRQLGPLKEYKSLVTDPNTLHAWQH